MLSLPHDFGRYVLTHLIGEGGMAEVYAATVRVAEGLEKRVVVKRIRREFADQREFMRMFVDEAKIALSLNHANIVQVFDFGQVEGDFYLAMERVEGIDLMQLYHAVRRAGDNFPPVITAYIAHQVVAGLAYAHRKTDDLGKPLGIVHRDASPHNIMVSAEGQVKILDFGIARTRAHTLERLGNIELAMASPSHQGDAETIKGKVAYMSPEQAHGQPVDPRSDIYSLGIVLHELISGRLLYRTKDRLAALEQVRAEAVRPLLEVAPDVSPDLAAIVDRCLARDPDERYPSARALQAALAAYLHGADPVVDDEVLSNFVTQYYRPQRPSHWDLRAIDDGSASGSASAADPDTGAAPEDIANRRQRQRIVVVFIALRTRPGSGSDDRPADPRTFVSLARDVAFKRDAFVLRDDDQALVLAFGTLLRTGDDAERALRVALTLRDDAGEAAPRLRLGFVVANAAAIVQRDGSGFMQVELRPSVESQLERIARRYMEGPVMVSGNLVEALSRTWRFGGGGFVDSSTSTGSASGIDRELEHVAPLLGPAREAEGRVHLAPGARNVLFGRELELKTLRDTFADAIRRRQSRSVLVIGESGLGKRALVERLVASMPRTACWVLRASGSWSRRNVPFGVFLDLLARFLDIGHRTTAAEITSKLERHSVKDASQLAETLAHALGLPDAAGRDIDASRRRDRLWRLVRRLITGLARGRPVLVVIENIHLHDEQSIALLREWVQTRQPYPVMGLVTGRPGNRRVALVRREPNVTEIVLGELDHHARHALVVRRFEDPRAVEPLAAQILSHTGGNPMFIEQVLASLLEKGVIGWNSQGRYLVVRQPDAKIELPRSIEAALQERLCDLPRQDQEVLQAAAVLGRTFRPTELAALLDTNQDQQDGASPTTTATINVRADKLMGRGLLERIEGAPSPGESMRFATVSLHEACKTTIPRTAMPRLHAHAAKIRRARHDYASERDDGPIADHLVAAGRLEDAVVPALAAAALAREVAGNREAYHYLSLALEGLPNSDVRHFDTLLLRERILRAWGRRRAQGADVRGLLAAADALDDHDRRTIALLRLLRFYVEIGRGQLAERLVPRVQEAIAAVKTPRPFRAVACELRSELHFIAGDFAQAERLAREGLTLCADDARGKRQRARLLRSIGQVYTSVGRYPEARRTYEESLATARQIGNMRLEANLLNSLGEVAGRSTRYQAAVDLFKAALAIDRELGDRFATGRKLANLGITYAAVGLHRRAERYLRKALELHEAVGHPAEFNDVIVHLGDVVASLGHLQSARELLNDAARVAVARGDVRTELRARVRLAVALLEHGTEAADLALARKTAQDVLDTAPAPGLRTSRRRALYVLGQLAERDGERTLAIKLHREAVNLVRAGADPLEGVRSIYRLGVLLRESGDLDAAKPLLEEAATKLEARLEDLRDADLRRGYLKQADAR
ncbi:MAG: protein kinase, partial [Nannocystaceae bacterium]|nr:protein kinase [Nannocystaceae bacterium]